MAHCSVWYNITYHLCNPVMSCRSQSPVVSHVRSQMLRLWLLLVVPLLAPLSGRAAADAGSRRARQATSLDDQLQVLLSGGTSATPTTATTRPPPSPQPTAGTTSQPTVSSAGTGTGAGTGGRRAEVTAHSDQHTHTHSHHSHAHGRDHHEERMGHDDRSGGGAQTMDHGRWMSGHHYHHYETRMHHHHDSSPGHHSGGSGAHSHHDENYMGGTAAPPDILPLPLSGGGTDGDPYTTADGRYRPAGRGERYGVQTGYTTGNSAGSGSRTDPVMEAYFSGLRLAMEAERERRYQPDSTNTGSRYYDRDSLSGDRRPYSSASGSYWRLSSATGGSGSRPPPGTLQTDSDPVADAFLSGYAAGLGSTVVTDGTGDRPGWDGATRGGSDWRGSTWNQQRQRASTRYNTPTSRVTRAGATADRRGSPAPRPRPAANTTSPTGPGVPDPVTVSLSGTSDPSPSPAGGAGAVQLATYVIEATRAGYETRYYPASRWVCAGGPTAGGGSCTGDERGCLRRLRRYLAGENTAGVTLRQTAPLLLLMDTPADDTSSAAGPPPASAVCSLLATEDIPPPPPLQENGLFLLRQPNTRLYVTRLSGQRPALDDHDVWTAEGARLRQRLRGDGASFDGSRLLAFLYPDGGREVGVIASVTAAGGD